jgi:ClpP class serine protease
VFVGRRYSFQYDKHTGNKAIPLKKKEQKTLKLYLDDVYKEIIKIVEAIGI